MPQIKSNLTKFAMIILNFKRHYLTSKDSGAVRRKGCTTLNL